MGVVSVEKDFDGLTMVIVAEWDVPVERAWQLWADPRQLERWWGPPGYPATVESHELVPGGRIAYYMTGPGPEAVRYPGWWEVLEVEAPRLLVVRDGFALEDGTPNPELPETLMRVEFTASGGDGGEAGGSGGEGDGGGEAAAAVRGGGTVMTLTSTFPTRQAFEDLLAMGAEEGMKAAMGQIDAVLGL